MMALVDGISKKGILKRLIHITAVLLIALMPGTHHPMATEAEQRSEIKINLRKGTLSVQISNMPLVDVLQIIGDEAGFKLMMLGSREYRITQRFSEVPLAEGIHRLAGNRSVAIMYQIVDAPDNRKAIQDIKEVWVFDSDRAAVDEPDSETRKNFSKKDPEILSSTDLSQPENPEPVTGTDSTIDPQKYNPPQPDGAGIKDAVTYPQFDPESDVGYWADRLIKSADRSSREQAITELQRIGSDTAVAAIATVLGDDDSQLRHHAVESLAMTDNDNAVLLIGQTLIGDRDPSVRLAAVRFFAAQNSEVSRAFLNTALKDKDPQVQSLARQALGNK